jgi:hypothetical protein
MTTAADRARRRKVAAGRFAPEARPDPAEAALADTQPLPIVSTQSLYRAVLSRYQLTPDDAQHLTGFEVDAPTAALMHAGDPGGYSIADTCCGKCTGGTCYVDGITGA